MLIYWDRIQDNQICSPFDQSNVRDDRSVRSVDLETVDSWFEKDLERTDLLNHRCFYPWSFLQFASRICLYIDNMWMIMDDLHILNELH